MELQGINLNITGRDEHVPEIERFIRTVKERLRAIANTLPFEILPHRLIIEIVYNVMFWLNCFPHKDRIHTTLSPHTIVTGSKINYDKHCKLQFGAYLQVHEQHNSSMIPSISKVKLRIERNKGDVMDQHLYEGFSSMRYLCCA